MRKLIFVLLWMVCCINPTLAATSLQLEPANGSIVGKAGDTVGWGFVLVNTQNYLVVTGAEFQTSAHSGEFTDFISAPNNFFVVGSGFGGSSVWAQSFDEATKSGIGSFTIATDASPGSIFGRLVLSYDLFSRSPADPLFDPDLDTLANGELLTASAVVTVNAGPLPGGGWLFGAASAVWGANRRRYLTLKA